MGFRLSFTDCRMFLEDDNFHREGKGKRIVCKNKNLNVLFVEKRFVENGQKT